MGIHAAKAAEAANAANAAAPAALAENRLSPREAARRDSDAVFPFRKSIAAAAQGRAQRLGRWDGRFPRLCQIQGRPQGCPRQPGLLQAAPGPPESPGIRWKSSGIHGIPLESMGNLWKSMKFHGKSMGNQWNPWGIIRNHWKTVKSQWESWGNHCKSQGTIGKPMESH